MTGLLDIRDAVQQVSEAIASVLDIDVIISDADYQIIGDTKKHYKLEVKEIKDNYVIGNVIKTGITEVIRGKADSEHCSSCEIQENCNLEAMICVPIHYLGTRIGAIGLIAITESSRERLLENQKNLIEFTERMADLIVSKLREKEATTKLTVAKNQLISIMDAIDEGIAATDENGRIVYLNSVFEEILNSKHEELIGKDIAAIFAVPYVTALINNGTEFNSIELHLSTPDLDVHSLISGSPVILEDKNAGSIIVLKKMEDVFKVINKLTNTSLSTSFEQIIGDSPAMIQLKETALRVAAGNSSILITGESGTGKELFARAIHHSSPRNKNPFIAINCAAMPEALIESELFGYEEGSFTGASRGGRPGKFQLAHGGTIFLDEIGDMPLHLQPKLLRVIQEKTVEKLGGHKSLIVDVRLITATNKDLEGMVDRGEFREDLYYRINVIPLHIPPLRSRPDDVRMLLSCLLKQYNAKLNKKLKGFTADAENALLSCRWKGNVRELANVIEYAINVEPSAYITTNSLPFKILEKREVKVQTTPVSTLHLAESELIRSVLSEFGSSVAAKRRAAEALGISLSTLYRKLKEMGIDQG
jgi:transcriptional regulator with PAS, ATPase and Fis domain